MLNLVIFLAGFCHRVNMCLSGLMQTRIEKHWSRAVFSSAVHWKLPNMLTFLSQSCRFLPFLLFSALFAFSLLQLLLLTFGNCDVSTHISSSGDALEYLVLDISFLIPFVVKKFIFFLFPVTLMGFY